MGQEPLGYYDMEPDWDPYDYVPDGPGTVLQCDHCGRFFSSNSNYDSYVPFGGSTDLDEPDEVLMCESCTNKHFRQMIKRGFPNNGEWIPSHSTVRAATVLGFAQAGPPGAGWSVWHKKNGVLPEGFTWRNTGEIIEMPNLNIPTKLSKANLL